ncbi:4Fe-4S binding protein [Allocoprobacillus halotolerans]|uniref:4Fe-4S binding protein n=1 Tax=Allocoprobacillus halotolerans TaxID=2944914 RepID=A0ABY5I5J2_9FIRM|nr:4Fe-4S dicluster domain-containing protein [Allocoprobacillus halotolerans]UTY40596.1 4Fe-4S binding protein [Allocoprobacillus halotolerans]
MICIMTSKCIGCTICKQVCSTGNIQIVDGKAQRIAATCDFCLACVHHCPFHAIGLKTEKIQKQDTVTPK